MKNIACFDIGGTFIKYAVIDTSGLIHFKSQVATPRSNCKVSIPQQIEVLVAELSKEYVIGGIGISTAGNVDSEKGEILFASDNLPDYTGARLSETLVKGTGLPCHVENDVNAAALGESWMGAGKGASSFVCVTLGTGVGGAIVLNNQLVKGVRNGAGEIGHMVVNTGGISCGCGGEGCFEQYASTRALVRDYAHEINETEDQLNGKTVMEKVIEKDPIALKVYKRFIHHIATGLASVVHLLDPGLIILGGGISENGQSFIDDLNTSLQVHLIPTYRGHTHIRKALLGNDAGLMGACRLFVGH